MIPSTNRYTNAIIKNLWLLIVAALIAGGSAYTMRSRQPPQYQSEARLFVGSTISSPDPDVKQIDISNRLAVVYANLISPESMSKIISTLDLPETPDQLRNAVVTDVISNTPIMIVRVSYPNPETAAAITNYIAEYLTERSASNLTVEQQQRVEALPLQIKDLEAQIAVTNGQAMDVLARLNTARTHQEDQTATRLGEEYQRLVEQLNASRAVLEELSDTFIELSDRANRLHIIERARPLNNPVGISPTTIGITGAIVGVVLAVGVLLLAEHSTDMLRTREEVKDALALPLLGWISKSRSVGRGYKNMLVVERLPESQIVEEYRRFRMNLQAQHPRPNPIYLVTSAGVGEGKSLSVSNLAVSMALSGAHVLLIDADMRRPILHHVFQLTNEVGLAMLLGEGGGNLDVERVVQSTHISGLWVLPSGSVPSHVGELLGSDAMRELLDILYAKYSFDIILMDTPPCLMVADASALAVGISASVILVIAAERTRRAAAMKAKEQFEQLGANIAGVVFNRTRDHEHAYFDHAHHRI